MGKTQPVLITDAARSQADEHRSRKTRYVIMMVTRAGCLVLGAVLISAKVPLLPVWLGLCVLGMVFLPWAAVLIANDRAPKKKSGRPAPVPTARPRAIDDSPSEAVKPRIIDVEP